MEPTKPIDETIKQWAIRQLADYDQGTPGTLFADGHVLTVAEAYKLQTEVVRLRHQRGERIVGYKVGCTSPKIRMQLGIDHSISGRLFKDEKHDSGVKLSRERFANLAIEGELAIELSRAPTPDDFSEAFIPACVSRVFPVIELHNHVIRGDTPTAGELIANNAIHAGFVAGTGIKPSDFLESNKNVSPNQSSLKIKIDEDVVDECDGAALVETIHSSLSWLMDCLETRDQKLEPGQIILTGSIPSLIRIESNCHVQVNAPPFGSVEVNFTDEFSPDLIAS